MAGQLNPAIVTVTTPSAATARFDLTYLVSSDDGMQLDVGAASNVDIRFTVSNANPPLVWVASGLPQGLFFVGGS